uniref:Uncharacterized protein n=1 Tax=Anguilla anguilla TaxID=7936 RepID=A0A0E9TVX8_ANGAN
MYYSAPLNCTILPFICPSIQASLLPQLQPVQPILLDFCYIHSTATLHQASQQRMGSPSIAGFL